MALSLLGILDRAQHTRKTRRWKALRGSASRRPQRRHAPALAGRLAAIKAFAFRPANAYLNFKQWFEIRQAMTRPSEVTRDRILKAAERLFAEHGYEGTSVRAIVAKARVNQAAINYHFDGKDGLYRDVLRGAFRALTEHQLSHADEVKSMSREEALKAFVRRQLWPLMARDELSRHLRLLNWETVRPTAVFRQLMKEEAAPFIGLAVDLVRRFLPEADHRTLVVAAIWIMGQCNVFVRNREQLAGPPADLSLDESTVEWLAQTISHWTIGALMQSA